jgi:putative ABC transport system permease protein
MFFRLWRRGISLKRPQTVVALGALLTGAAVASMLLNLYGDARRKMTRELAAYGPNAVVSPAVPLSGDPSGGLLDDEVVDRLKPLASGGIVAVPVLYTVARIEPHGVPGAQATVVSVGADFEALRALNPAWHVDGLELRGARGQCVLGVGLAERLKVRHGGSIVLRAGEGSAPVAANPAAQRFTVAALVSTGSAEDDRVFVPLEDLQDLTGLHGKVSLVELRIPGDEREVDRVLRELQSLAPGIEARPVRQIVESEAQVLRTVRQLSVVLTLSILAIIALCVVATMTAILLERRRDIAVMKAVGADDSLVMKLFLAEATALGMAGGAAGWALGLLLARQVGRSLFGVTLQTAAWTFPAVTLVTAVLAFVSTLLPVAAVRSIQPALVLKGE